MNLTPLKYSLGSFKKTKSFVMSIVLSFPIRYVLWLKTATTLQPSCCLEDKVSMPSPACRCTFIPTTRKTWTLSSQQTSHQVQYSSTGGLHIQQPGPAGGEDTWRKIWGNTRVKRSPLPLFYLTLSVLHPLSLKYNRSSSCASYLLQHHLPYHVETNKIFISYLM